MEISSIPSDDEKWEARKIRRKQDRMRRKKMGQISNVASIIDRDLSYFGQEYQHEWMMSSVFDEQTESQKNLLDLAPETSSIPTDPAEWERRKQLREEANARRRELVPPNDDVGEQVKNDLLLYGDEYQMEYQRLSRKRNCIKRYPVLYDVIKKLKAEKLKAKRNAKQQREEKKARRRGLVPPTVDIDGQNKSDLLLYGDEYQMKYQRLFRKRKLIKRYPGLYKVVKKLMAERTEKKKQNLIVPPNSPMSPMTPMSPMSTMSPMSPMSTTSPMSPMSTTSPMSPMSTTSPMSPMSTTSPMSPMSPMSPNSPTHQGTNDDPAVPFPAIAETFDSKIPRIRVRAVEEINALPEDQFMQLLTFSASATDGPGFAGSSFSNW